MRTLVRGVCGLTLAASLWLGTMFVVLHRPGYGRGVAMAVLFALQSVLALAVVNGQLPARRFRPVAVAGAVAMTIAGVVAVRHDLDSRHFEGYTLAIGVLLVLQGALTSLHLSVAPPSSSSKVHQFGK